MTGDASIDPAVLQLAGEISDSLDSGTSEEDVISELVASGLPEVEAGHFVRQISDARNLNISVVKSGRFSRFEAIAGELLGLLVSAIVLCLLAIGLSKVISFVAGIFDLLPFRGIGDVVAEMGAMFAGAGLGFVATAVANESRSIGVLIGCWVGVALYYAWFFKMM